MYKVHKNTLTINGKDVRFKFNIEKIIENNDNLYVLLHIPPDLSKNELNNIYCINKKGETLWQSEDLNSYNPNKVNLSYMYMIFEDGSLFASDFMTRRYQIDPDNGKILGVTLTR